MTEVTEALRVERGLRVVASKEEGTDVFRLPDGVYGFTYAPAYKEMPIFAERRLHSFEVHRLKDGSVHLIGFVTPAMSEKILAKAAMVEAIMYPDSYPGSTELVSLDVDDMQPAKKALAREDGNPLKTLVNGGQ